MSNRSPIFPMPEPQHFSDYGFDPQIDYFQLLEGARNRKRKTVTARLPVDSLHLKLRKPISNEDSAGRKVHKAKNKKKKWWRNAVLFFKWKCIHSNDRDHYLDRENAHEARGRGFRASVSGSVYLIDSLSGSSTPSRSTSRPSSGALAGTLTPARKGDLEIPYLSLMDLNMEQQQQRRGSSTSANPIYLVT
ncbi:Serine hydroxymethyltransferase [Salix suchowensis]|nr:Serine hydroxymethyltransferase [Salix suchowensis]